MAHFDELLEKFHTGDKTAQEQMIALFGYLKDREITILREYYGIGFNPKSAEEIADRLGLEIDEFNYIYKKVLSKIECIFEKYPQICSEQKEISGNNIEVDPNNP